MKYFLETLPNKVKVLITPMPSLESATVTVWVKTGSRNEEDKIAGISHFLEHIVFKGSKKRPSAKEISEAIDEIGGEFNAATSKEWTNFHIKARKESLNTVFDVLSDMVLNPILDEKEIEKEKGVILEEIAMYEDTPIYHIGDVFERSIFDGNNLGRDVIGFVKSVKEIKKDDFVLYRKRYYYPENILITVSGGVDKKEVINLSNKYFGGLKSKLEKENTYSNFVSDQKKPKTILLNKENEQAHLILGFLGNKRDSKDKFIEAVTISILGGGMSSRMFTEVREKRGLAYAVKVSSDHYKDTGEVATYAGVDPKNAIKAIKVILDEYYGLAQKTKKISKKELIKAKEYLKGQLALSLEDTGVVNDFFGVKALFGLKINTPEEIYKEIDKVKEEDIYKYAEKVFVPEKLNLAIIGPFTQKSLFEKALK
jgi:predicted Zn-dependent peptidase